MINRLSKVKLGILGGGQLARMMALKCHEMGIQPHILSANPTDPGAEVTTHFTKGNLDSKKDLRRFLHKVDLAIFENEFLDPVLLHEASLSANTPIHPRPKIMNLLQDRLSQKNLLKKYKIPTARFVEVSPKAGLNNLIKVFPKGLVLKKRRQGYDGYGIFTFKPVKNLGEKGRGEKNLDEKLSQAEHFLHKNSRLIAEELIFFKRELALILFRNRKGQIVEMPLVQTFQEQNRCLWVKGPIQHPKKQALIKKLKHLMKDTNYEGALAFELFETKTGALMINEMAPRVHNSGHYSLNGLSEDQFSLHIKAVLNLELKTPLVLAKGFAMLNLLGESFQEKWLTPEGAILHWYGKHQSRLGRKMGHINHLGITPNKALDPLMDFYLKHKKKG